MKRIFFITLLGLFIGSLAWSQQTKIDYAKELLKKDKPKEALSVLQSLLPASPKDENLWLLLARSYQKIGNLDSAELAAQKTVELEDDMSEAYLVLSQVQLAKNKSQDACTTAKTGLRIKKKQDYAPLWVQLGKTLIAIDSADAALIAFSKGRELNPADAESYAGLGDAYLKLPQPVFPMAIDQYEKSLQVDSTRADVLYKLANTYVKDRQYTEAARTYVRLISLQPNNDAARLEVARLYFRAKQYSKCAAALKEYFVKEKNPNKDEQQMYLEALYNSHQYKEAVPVAKSYLTIDPKSAIALRVIAQGHIDEKQYAQAVETFKNLAAVDTMRYDDYRLLGLCYGYLKKDSLSAATFELALALDSTKAVIWGEAAGHWMSIQQWSRAAACYERRIALDTTVTVITAYFNYANCLMQLNRFDDAEVALGKAIEKNPKYPPSYVRMGFCYVAEKKFVESRSWFEKAVKVIDNASEKYRLELADSYKMIGLSYMLDKKDEEHPLKRWEDAVLNLEKALKCKEDDASTHLWLAQSYQNLNKKELAIQHYKRARQLDPKNKEAQKGLDALSPQ
jgi:tetratricopeptide (TPR) repeat protein